MVIVLADVANLASTALTIAIQRDWIVVITGYNRGHLAGEKISFMVNAHIGSYSISVLSRLCIIDSRMTGRHWACIPITVLRYFLVLPGKALVSHNNNDDKTGCHTAACCIFVYLNQSASLRRLL